MPYTIDYRIRRADTGEERWLQSYGMRIDYEDRRPSRFVGRSRSTSLRASTPRTNCAKARRGSAPSSSRANDFLITTTLDQRVTSVNPAVLAALGFTEEEVIGRPVSDFMDADQFAISRAALEQKLATGGTTRLTLRVHARDGRELIWELNSRLNLDDQGKPTGLHAIGRDMTEAKRAETHQRLLIDELNHRVKNTLAIVQGIAQQTFPRGAPIRSPRGLRSKAGSRRFRRRTIC
ncbi:MAG: PAS domain S-box protein [Sphingomonas sp.]